MCRKQLRKYAKNNIISVVNFVTYSKQVQFKVTHKDLYQILNLRHLRVNEGNIHTFYDGYIIPKNNSIFISFKKNICKCNTKILSWFPKELNIKWIISVIFIYIE